MFGHSTVRLSAGLELLVLLCFGAAGCGHVPSENEALRKSLEVNGGSQQSVVKFSGTVTVDGQPPAVDRRNPLFVMAYDPQHPPKGRETPFTTRCDKSGHFEFNTYGTGDGLPAGSYVAIFAQPIAEGRDGLKNLCNDPDKNAKEERFQINLTSPGKTDWTFDLQVAGQDAVTTPGEHAVMEDRGRKRRD
jgi:hypothetical protein